MKKYPSVLLIGCLLLMGAGCAKEPEYQLPKITRTSTLFATSKPSVASRRCEAILPLEEASRLTGASFKFISSQSEDEENSVYSAVDCTYDTQDLKTTLVFSVFTSRRTLLEASTYSAFRDEHSIPLPDLGQDAYYSPEPRRGTSPRDRQGLTEILINDRLGIELGTSFDQQIAEKLARAIFANFATSEYYRELQQRLEAHPVPPAPSATSS